MKQVFGYIAVLVISIVLGSLGTMAWKYYTARISGIANAERQIESAPSRIAGYEAYFDQCAAIQGYEGALDAQRSMLAVPKLSAEDSARIQTVITGISAQRARAIAQYNADVRKEYTQARFLDAGLPKNIDLQGKTTQCAN